MYFNYTFCGRVFIDILVYHSVQNFLSSSLLLKNVRIKMYRTIILPVVLYGCENWSLTLREVCRLRVFENKVLRRIFGSKRKDSTGEWRRLPKKELYTLHSSPNIFRVTTSRRLRWAGYVGRMRESRGAYRSFVVETEGRRPLGRPRCKWEDNIKKDITEVGWGMNWIDVAQDRDRWRTLMNAVINL